MLACGLQESDNDIDSDLAEDGGILAGTGSTTWTA